MTPPVTAVLALPPRLRAFVLKRWLARQGAPTPGRAQLQALLQELLTAREDGTPCVAWQQVAVRRHDGRLYLTPATLPPPAPARRWAPPWPGLESPTGTLRVEPGGRGDLSEASLAAGEVWIRHRRGGERLRPRVGGPRRELKTLFQEARVPPWRRADWPLVYVDDTLAAVPGLAVAAEFQAVPNEAALALCWTPAD